MLCRCNDEGRKILWDGIYEWIHVQVERYIRDGTGTPSSSQPLCNCECYNIIWGIIYLTVVHKFPYFLNMEVNYLKGIFYIS